MPRVPPARSPSLHPPDADVDRSGRPRPRVPARALAVATLLASAPLLAQQPYDVALRDGLLSIRANGTPITELASALAAETGISFVVTGDAGTPITTEIVDEPFAKAVAKLSPNHLLVTDGESDDAAVVEVVLMLDDAADGGGGGDGGFLPSGAPADGVIGGEEPPLDEQALEEPLESFDEPLMEPDATFDGTVEDGTVMPNDGLSPDGELPLAQ